MEREHNQQSPPDPLSIDRALNQKILVGRVDTNVTQDFIIITADRARLVLRDAVGNMERSTAWQTPLARTSPMSKTSLLYCELPSRYPLANHTRQVRPALSL